ncbi:MAG: 30S ribosomal protein S20 [Candidatus Roizmanbacteria bacterium GW2011_GWA2_32_13]|uniref:Small ribosomal subunit protein bS20 n=1 Tax=Candidatus Roizmanbacteria bacterium GW2011_GWA2_32_13 TaxID=1618475 RepID=A0A0F9YXM6_9BACT|nr:MAG: 30S ribosomal protein S20 [Candidatus Roizmanbacteria bacterium GW2011_GWA2_32_13]
MPHNKSTAKRLRQDKILTERNKTKKKAYKSIKNRIKKGEINLMPEFYKAVDKASKSGVIHKNKAAREKSRLEAFIKKTEKNKTVKTSKKIITKSVAKKTSPSKKALNKKASK